MTNKHIVDNTWMLGMLGQQLTQSQEALESIDDSIAALNEREDYQNSLRQAVFSMRKAADLALEAESPIKKYFRYYCLKKQMEFLNWSEASFHHLEDKEYFCSTSKLISERLQEVEGKLSEEVRQELADLADHYGYLEGMSDYIFFIRSGSAISAIQKRLDSLKKKEIVLSKPPWEKWFPYLATMITLGIYVGLISGDQDPPSLIGLAVGLAFFIIATIAIIGLQTKHSRWERSPMGRHRIKLRAMIGWLENSLKEFDVERLSAIADKYGDTKETASILDRIMPIASKYDIFDCSKIETSLDEAIKCKDEEVIQRMGVERPDLAALLKELEEGN